MNKKIIFLIVLSITLGSGYYFFFRPIPISQSDKMKVEELKAEPLTIVYSNEGYFPKQISVKKGETVKFINMSDRRVWTASNEHPAHLIYPEFDQKTAASRGNEYSFKFDRVGIWEFHNHANASHIGKVIVTE